MNPALLVSVLVSLLATRALGAAPAQRSVDILAWPLSSASPQTLASVSYTSSNATLNDYRTPRLAKDEAIVRVGFRHASGSWSGVATSADSFLPGKDRNIRLLLDTAGELYHLGFKAAHLPASGSGKSSSRPADGVSVEVVKTEPAPLPIMNKPVVLNEQGEVEAKEPEKTFLQRYWWVFVAVLAVQMIMGAAGGGKE